MHSAKDTFLTKMDAEGWLAAERRLIDLDDWSAPADRARRASGQTLAHYADDWLIGRTLKPRTREHYRRLLDRQILPALGERRLKALTPVLVRNWHTDLGTATPTLRAHAYGLLRTILGSAVRDGLLTTNPCHVRGAGISKRVHKIKPLTLAELEQLVINMPAKYRTMTLLAAWCGLRFGELAELRRADIDQTNMVVKVRRGVTRAEGRFVIGTPKSDAGIRDVSIPPHLMVLVTDHYRDHAQPGRDGLLFPAANGGHLAPSSLYRVFYPARKAAGRPDLRWHDLRHTGAVLAAQTGATLAELMGRLGHSTPGAALRYQHAAQDRDRAIAAALSKMASGS